MENGVIHFTEEAPIDLRFRRTLSAGMASAASSATLRPGSSPHAIPAGVAALHSNQFVHSTFWVYADAIFLPGVIVNSSEGKIRRLLGGDEASVRPRNAVA
ncbi:hypothetical protein X953_00485 [Virgibacillus sp. SK37]|nr:hypothetical protein X953_00485 [Virgibacillus sp. SK37]